MDLEQDEVAKVTTKTMKFILHLVVARITPEPKQQIIYSFSVLKE